MKPYEQCNYCEATKFCLCHVRRDKSYIGYYLFRALLAVIVVVAVVLTYN